MDMKYDLTIKKMATQIMEV